MELCCSGGPEVSKSYRQHSRPFTFILRVALVPDTAFEKKKKKFRGLSPRANYTDRATAACQRH
jgi:hypothetical protein